VQRVLNDGYNSKALFNFGNDFFWTSETFWERFRNFLRHVGSVIEISGNGMELLGSVLGTFWVRFGPSYVCLEAPWKRLVAS
jgi:hypothetical protein